MDTADNVARAARNLITEHGTASENIALARAKSAEESDQQEVAHIWRDIAEAVSKLQGRRDR
jgi:hypothetical protein